MLAKKTWCPRASLLRATSQLRLSSGDSSTMSRRKRRKEMPQYPADTSAITPSTSRITCGRCARRLYATVTFASHSCSESISLERMGWSCRQRSIQPTISAHTLFSVNVGAAVAAAKYRAEDARAADGAVVPVAEVSARGIERSRIPDGTATVTRLTHKPFAKLAASALGLGGLFAPVAGALANRHAVHVPDMGSSPTFLVFKRWHARCGTCRPISDLQPIRLFELLSEEGQLVPGDWSRSN